MFGFNRNNDYLREILEKINKIDSKIGDSGSINATELKEILTSFASFAETMKCQCNNKESITATELKEILTSFAETMKCQCNDKQPINVTVDNSEIIKLIKDVEERVRYIEGHKLWTNLQCLYDKIHNLENSVAFNKFNYEKDITKLNTEIDNLKDNLKKTNNNSCGCCRRKTERKTENDYVLVKEKIPGTNNYCFVRKPRVQTITHNLSDFTIS